MSNVDDCPDAEGDQKFPSEVYVATQPDANESCRDRFLLGVHAPLSYPLAIDAVDRYNELEAEGVLGGWNMWEFAPVWRSSFGGRVPSVLRDLEIGISGTMMRIFSRPIRIGGDGSGMCGV